MSQNSKIEWTDATWNPLGGCLKISPGCKNCYAIGHAHRLAGNPNPKIRGAYSALTVVNGAGTNWTGDVVLNTPKLAEPLNRRKPTRYFVNSLSDLFFENFPDAWVDQVFAAMACCPQHTFQVLTKRAERMKLYCTWNDICAPQYPRDMVDRIAREMDSKYDAHAVRWPLPNVWMGVSVESRDYLHRIDHLRQTPAAVRFLSLEPLLEDLGDMQRHLVGEVRDGKAIEGVDWVIVGGESGPGARPMHPAWVRNIREQCIAAGVKFFFKQWGAWEPIARADGFHESPFGYHPSGLGFSKVGKKKAGRVLDGRTWDEMPEGVRTQNA